MNEKTKNILWGAGITVGVVVAIVVIYMVFVMPGKVIDQTMQVQNNEFAKVGGVYDEVFKKVDNTYKSVGDYHLEYMRVINDQKEKENLQKQVEKFQDALLKGYGQGQSQSVKGPKTTVVKNRWYPSQTTTQPTQTTVKVEYPELPQQKEEVKTYDPPPKDNKSFKEKALEKSSKDDQEQNKKGSNSYLDPTR